MTPFSTRQSARLARKDFLANDNALVEVFKELEKRGAIVMDSATATKLFDALEDKAEAELNSKVEDYVNIESAEEEEPEQPPKKTRRATRASATAANEAKSEKSEGKKPSKKNLKHTPSTNVPSSRRKNAGSPKKARSLGDS
ncbi:hypothetical protein BDZ89DRAFT_1074940 [Hymenopellis radicata]|nr:hypothetical protein BDZ89DRAFT_1074940 [Hymenopellis radicata]